MNESDDPAARQHAAYRASCHRGAMMTCPHPAVRCLTWSLLGVVLLAGCAQQGAQTGQDGPAAALEEASPAPGEAPVSECDSAFAAASSAAPGPQQDEERWATFDACGDLDEFISTAAVYPDTLEDEPEAFVTRACEEEAAVADSTLCAALQPAG